MVAAARCRVWGRLLSPRRGTSRGTRATESQNRYMRFDLRRDGSRAPRPPRRAGPATPTPQRPRHRFCGPTGAPRVCRLGEGSVPLGERITLGLVLAADHRTASGTSRSGSAAASRRSPSASTATGVRVGSPGCRVATARSAASAALQLSSWAPRLAVLAVPGPGSRARPPLAASPQCRYPHIAGNSRNEPTHLKSGHPAHAVRPAVNTVGPADSEGMPSRPGPPTVGCNRPAARSRHGRHGVTLARTTGSIPVGAPRLPLVNTPPPAPGLTRTCPWCAEARVIAFSDEGLVRALSRHLESCPGATTDEPPPAT
jgi:hypothetical protein